MEERADCNNEEHRELEDVVQKDMLVKEKEPLPLSAYITMVFLYFQIASLVHVPVLNEETISSHETDHENGAESFRKGVFDFFNFRVSIPITRTVCPTDELTLPMKEFINIALKLCSISNLLVFFIAYKCLKFPKILKKKSRQSEDEYDENGIAQQDDEEKKLSFTSILKIGFLKLVKLNCTSISTFAFNMVHCVTINNHNYLYLYADQHCWAPWQKVILFLVVPLIVLFPASFGMSLNLLKGGLITTNSFLCASVLPIYSFYLYVRKRMSRLHQRKRSGNPQSKT